MNTVKPGYQTTEFWVAAISAATTFATALAGALPPADAAYVTAAISGLYAISRGLAKKQP